MNRSSVVVWPAIVGTTLLLGLAIGFTVGYSNDTQRVAAIGATIGSAGTLLLVGVSLFAVFVALKQLSENRHQAQRQHDQNLELARVEHLVNFEDKFDRPPMADYRKRLATARLDGHEEPSELSDVLNFFETIGLLVKRGFLDATDVWDTFSYWIFNLYADVQGAVARERADDPLVYGNLMGLVEQLVAIEHAKGGHSDQPSSEDIVGFWKEESRLLPGTPVPKKRSKSSKRSTNATTA